MRFNPLLLILMILFMIPFSSCEKDQEAATVHPTGGGPSGGSGGSGGGGGSQTGPVDPDSIDIGSEPIWSCDGSGTDYVLYDSTSWHSALLSNAGGATQAVSQFGFGIMPYLTNVSFYGFTWTGADATQAEMDMFFTTGTKTFGMGPSASVSISMAVDDSGDINSIYQTSFVASQPAGSHFTVTDVQPYDDGSGSAGIKMRATWQCRLQNANGDAKDCVDGIFVGYFTGNAIP